MVVARGCMYPEHVLHLKFVLVLLKFSGKTQSKPGVLRVSKSKTLDVKMFSTSTLKVPAAKWHLVLVLGVQCTKLLGKINPNPKFQNIKLLMIVTQNHWSENLKELKKMHLSHNLFISVRYWNWTVEWKVCNRNVHLHSLLVSKDKIFFKNELNVVWLI